MPQAETLLARELLGSEVLDLSVGSVVGKVVDYALDRSGHVKLLGILPAAWFTGGLGLLPQDIAHVASGRVCIAQRSYLQPFQPDGVELVSICSDARFFDMPVLLATGESLGTLLDFSFDLSSGRIIELSLQQRHATRPRSLSLGLILTLGKDYIVVEPALTRLAPVEIPRAIVEPTCAASLPSLLADGSGFDVSSFDRKKLEFLLGREAHRDIRTSAGEVLVRRGALLDGAALHRVLAAGLLGEVFIETTLQRQEAR